MYSLSYKQKGKLAECKMTAEDISIGRDEECTIKIDDDPKVSRFHCSLLRYSDGSYWLIDSASKNGTYLNGNRIMNDEAMLKPGDTFRIGSTKFTLTQTSHDDTAAYFQEAEQEIAQGKSVNQALREIIGKRKAVSDAAGSSIRKETESDTPDKPAQQD